MAALRRSTAGGGLPIGITEDGVYTAETVSLSPGGRAMVVSDGIIEEFGVVQQADGSTAKAQFQMDGLRRSMSRSEGDDDYVANLFSDLIEHAGDRSSGGRRDGGVGEMDVRIGIM